MNKQNSNSGFLSGMAILVGLMPLAFTFSQNGAQLLLDTPFKYIVWCGQIMILLITLLTKINLSKNQLIGLSMFYLLIPFAFILNATGVTFLILTKYTSSILSWAIASVLFSKLLFNINFKPSH